MKALKTLEKTFANLANLEFDDTRYEKFGSCEIYTTGFYSKTSDFFGELDLIKELGKTDVFEITFSCPDTNGLILLVTEKSLKIAAEVLNSGNFNSLPEVLAKHIFAIGAPPRRGVIYATLEELNIIIENL